MALDFERRVPGSPEDLKGHHLWLDEMFYMDRHVTNCNNCGDHGVPIEPNDDGLTYRATTECAYTPTDDPIEWTIDFPSGKIVVDDSLHDTFGEYFVDGETDINSRKGMSECIILSNGPDAEVATGFVGNTCPSVIRDKDNPDKYYIVNLAYDDDSDEETNDLGERVASVCTDLWWFTIADYDLYISKGGKEDRGWSSDNVEVSPGTYRFKYHGERTSFDRDANWSENLDPQHVIWAEFELEKS